MFKLIGWSPTGNPKKKTVFVFILVPDQFIGRHLSLNVEDAKLLQTRYYKDYGLVLEGLLRHHKIDPMVFNREVDDALPLDSMLSPDLELRKLLTRLDRRNVKPWLLTNAHVSHATRVLNLLGVSDLFEGITFCDYEQVPLVCKPSSQMYERAELEAGAKSPDQCFFVGKLIILSAILCVFY